MDIDQLNLSNGNAKSSNKKLLDIKPVIAGSKGVGLPYAPENWPHEGDNWSWRVGNRKTAAGYWVDRYISPPRHFPRVSGCKARFQSRLSLEQYIRKEYPDADVDAFFASFSWKILADFTSRADVEKAHNEYTNDTMLEVSTSRGCKVGNEMCTNAKNIDFQYNVKACDICCNESGFCGDCCCILCSGSVNYAHGGFSFIRCRAMLEEGLICGHVAHVECALRAYMAGTVGGSIGLDVEYYCRRCDNKTDLIQHVLKIIETCESLDSSDEIAKILNLGSRILLGSEKIRAKNLRHRIGIITSKLNLGLNFTEIRKPKHDVSIFTDVLPFPGKEIIVLDSPESSRENTPTKPILDVAHPFPNGASQGPSYITSDRAAVSAELEDQIDAALRRLKSSQESEYRTAEEKLYAQKNLLLDLYRQLEAERGELAQQVSSGNGSDNDGLLSSILCRVDGIKREEEKLKQMMGIAAGFARTPDSILREYFDISVDY